MRILIVIDNLNLGGVATSLYNYLQVVSKEMCCDLLVFNEKSIDYTRIPDNVSVLRPQKILHILGMTREEMRKESVLFSIVRLGLFVLAKIFNGEIVRKVLFLFVKKIGNYDLAISYSQDDGWKSLSKGCNDFVLDKVVSNMKTTVIHCDYKNFGGYNASQKKQFERFNHIICLSNSCRNSFVECFPNLAKNVVVCENFIDEERIIKYSNNPIKYPANKFSFISVCRLSKVKGLDRGLMAFKSLHDSGYDSFVWTIVGDGPERRDLEEKIIEFDLADYVELVGKQANPYKYMKGADALLISSLHEAAPMLYGECATLGLPIITTDTCSAKELVGDRGIGLVVENSVDGLKKVLKDILDKRIDLSKFKISIQVNENAIIQFDKYISNVKSK